MIHPDVLVRDVVASNYQTADIFTRHGIDFCCGGGISLQDAAIGAGLEPGQLVAEIEQVMQAPDRETDLINRLPLDALCHYIVETHHAFVRANLVKVSDYLARIVMAHGDTHPELETVQQLFQGASVELTRHMHKEEAILFPRISAMLKAVANGASLDPAEFGSIRQPISVMEAEHDQEGNRFREISRLTHDYQVPADACNTYKVAMEKLKAFEKDLHRHVHLENNILFPKALQLEGTLGIY